MGRLLTLLVGVVIGGALVYGSMEYHLVRTQDGFISVAKINPAWNDTYVDVRNFGFDDWGRHKDLVAALLAAKKEQVLGDAAEGAMRDHFGQLLGTSK